MKLFANYFCNLFLYEAVLYLVFNWYTFSDLSNANSRKIVSSISKTPTKYLRWSSLHLTANYCAKQLHCHRCFWNSWIAHWKLYRKDKIFLTDLNEDNTDPLIHYNQTLKLENIEHTGILKSYDYCLPLSWYKHSMAGIL